MSYSPTDMKFLPAMIVCTLTLIASWLSAQSPYTPAPGVLVLRSGHTLSGQIARQGDSYQVVIAQGNEIRIPTRDVRLHSGSLEEAYQMQRDSLALNNLQGRLQLASWCLRSEMPHRAADQVLMVRMQDPAHADLAAVERRLAAFEMARRAARETQADADQAADSESPSNLHDLSALDEAIDQLSPELVESFAQRVQPLLVNRCGASGCHGYGSKNEFQLMRPSFQATFTRRYTQRNLVAVLGQIEKAAPDQSPLLEYASKVHGGEEPPALIERRNQQNELLAEWIRGVSGGKAAQPAAGTPAPPVPTRAASATKKLAEPRQQADAHGQPSEVEPVGFLEETEAEPDDPRPASPSNPVDPAVFNRQYHGRP
jgi:hypothetical protein